MPESSRHTLTGILRRTSLGYALEMDDGGVWRLDIDPAWNPPARLGRRVTVEGVPLGFKLLDVYRLYIA